MTVPRTPIANGIIVTFMLHSFFSFIARSCIISLLSHLFIFTLWSAERARSTIRQVLSFVLSIISSGRLAEIYLYLKILGEFVRLILQDRFWVVHITFVRMVKLQFLAQFPVYQLAYPVVPSLILSLCSFEVFAYYEIDRFVSYIT